MEYNPENCPVISIIIPVYNVEAFITECLSSVAAQTVTDGIECILVDDCGTDASIALAESFIDKYEGPVRFIIVHHEHNRGLSAARNTGIQASKGEYLLFLDSDDTLAPNAVEEMMRPLHGDKPDIIIGDYTVFGGEDTFMHLRMPEGECTGHRSIIEAKRKNLWYPMAWGKLYRRAFLENNGIEFCEGILHEDELFSVEAACLAQSLYCIPSLKSYNYRVRPGGIMTASQYERRRDSCRIMLTHMYDFLKINSLSKDAGCNDLLSYLFSFANETSWKYSEDEFLIQYAEYRNAVSKRYGERLACTGNRPIAIVRDLHYLFPTFIGRHIFRLQNGLRSTGKS